MVRPAAVRRRESADRTRFAAQEWTAVPGRMAPLTPVAVRPGIVGCCRTVPLLTAAMVGRPGIVRGCRRSASARMAVRGLPGDGRCQGAGSRWGRRGLARLISRRCAGRRLVCRRRARMEPRRRCRGRGTRGVRATAVPGFEHSRCRRRSNARAYGRRTGLRRVRAPSAG